jgi:hypothetical protein
MSPSTSPNEALPIADESSVASIIPLHQPKKAKTGAERSRAYRQRKRQKGKAAASPSDPSSELLIPEGFSSADQAFAVPPLTAAPPTVTVRDGARNGDAPSQIISSILLLAAALALAGVGIAMNGWFARSLGSSDIAGWLFLAIGVAADLIALVVPSCSARLWQARQRAISLVDDDLRLRRDGRYRICEHKYRRRDACARVTHHTSSSDGAGRARRRNVGAGSGVQRRGRKVLPGARSGGQRTAPSFGRCHSVGRTDGGPANRCSHPDRGMGNPWRAQADRRRFRDAPACLAGAAAADRRHTAHGRAICRVQQPTKFALVINTRTPKDTGPDLGHGGEVLMTSCFVP